MSEIRFTPHAKEIPIDDSICQLGGKTVNQEIDLLCQQVSVSASPAFDYTKSGNVSNNTWLLNGSVPSNKTGKLIFLNDASIKNIFISNELANTFDIEAYEHDGTTFTLLTTVSIVAARSGSFSMDVPLTTGKEIGLKLINGSGKNVVAGLILAGEL